MEGGMNQDMKVTLHASHTMHPSEPTERRPMFLSNIDQALNFHVKSVVFFSADAASPGRRRFDHAVATLRSALERLLVPYDFLAGRLRVNEEGRLEIDCNAAGATLDLASSELEMEELGELCPNPAFRRLTPMPEMAHELQHQPLCAFQATSFKCGGYSFGVSVNHSAMDAFGFSLFFLNLASLASNKPLPVPPSPDRRPLAARSPPRVTCAHPERVKLDEAEKIQTMLEATSDDLEFRLFHLDGGSVSFLKEMARAGSNGRLDPKAATSFNVVVAHLWRCKALATHGPDENKTSTLLYAVDIRRRVRPPLPLSYAGNAVLSAYAKATCRELEAGPFSDVVGLVGRGVARMTDEYIRSVIDWGELHRGFPVGDVFVTSWWRLGFGELEFGWGKPKFFCPLPNPRREIIMLYSDADGKGVNALVGLRRGNMGGFHRLFYNVFLPQQHRL